MTVIDPDPPTLQHGAPGEQCANCTAPLAADQRYCLNCGTRRAPTRVPVAAAGHTSPLAVTTSVTRAPGAAVPAAVQRLGGAWGVAALLLLALGVGVVIGRSGQSEAPVAAVPPAPVIISSGATGPAAATTIADTTAAKDEWPDQDGFTVQLGELPKDGTDQAAADAAKAAADAKGATDTGILDAGEHGLTEGRLVLYSGVFDTKKEATAALKDVKSAYPDARVIKVAATSDGGVSAAKSKPAAAAAADDDDTSGGGGDDAGSDAGASSSSKPATVSKSKLKEAENLAPEAFQKQSKKLPKTTALPGKPPEKDLSEPAGAGTEAETIG